MKTYVFPGQGSQTKGMGGTLFEEFKEFTEKADDILGYSIRELCLEDSKRQLSQTQYTQPALYIVNALSYYKKLKETGKKPDFVAGHSLGEYDALLASGGIDFETGLKLVKKRGELMSRATGGAMVAIVGLGGEEVEKILKENDLDGISIANYNAPTQIVISGLKDDIIKAEPFFQLEGIYYIPLNTSGAFHSRYMQSAREEFDNSLKECSFSELMIPVISNVHARPYKREDIMSNLSEQITHSVYWSESIRYLMGQGEMEFEEIGPGDVLTKLVRKIQAEASPLVINEEASGPNEISEKVEIAHEIREEIETPESIYTKDEAEAGYGIAVKEKKPDKGNLVFMYSGQGSHYYNMGKELYMKNDVFKKNMDQCSLMLEKELDKSLVAVIYDDSKKTEDFNDILYTHPALFCFGYSLTQVLYDRGIRPDSVLGYSVGEYIAAVVAGMLSLEEGLKIVVQQAKYLHEKCIGGGMLVVLDHVDSFKGNPQLFNECTLAGINYENNFVISGPSTRLEEISSQLNSSSIYSQLLPVSYAFHSELIDPIKNDFEKLTETLSFKPQQIPVYSSARAGNDFEPDNQYLWDVVREKTQFRELISLMQEQKESLFVDLSPTGTLANFVKYGFEKKVPSFFSINQFGQDIKTLDNLVFDLNSFRVN